MTIPKLRPFREWESQTTWSDALTNSALGEIVHTVELVNEEVAPFAGTTTQVWVCREVWGDPDGQNGHFTTVDYNPQGGRKPKRSTLSFTADGTALTWPGKLAGRPCDKLTLAAWVRGWSVLEAVTRWRIEEPYDMWDWLWDQPGMSTIAAAADLRRVSRWHALASVLAEVLGNIAPTAVLYGAPADPFPAGSLNTFIALVADPGGGKSSGLSLPKQIIDYGPLLRRACEGTLSSAAGVARTLDQTEDDAEDPKEDTVMGTPLGAPAGSDGEADDVETPPEWEVSGFPKPDPLRRVAADTEFSAAAMKFSDVGWQVLTKTWSGESLTDRFGDKKYNREVPAHTYRWTIAGGVQPEHVIGLMESTGGGLAQRFVWMPGVTRAVDYARAVKNGVRIDALPKITLREADTEFEGPIPVDPVVTDELVREDLARKPDGREAALELMKRKPPVDSHIGLVQLKLAAGLGLILGDGLRVTRRGWEVARVVMQVSLQHHTEVRRAVAERVHATDVEIEAHRQSVRSEAADIAEDSALERAVVEFTTKLRALGGTATRSELTQKVKRTVRRAVNVDEVFTALKARGLVTEAAEMSQSTTGREVITLIYTLKEES